MIYNWNLIERLLHEVQNGAGECFASRTCAENLAREWEQAGEHLGSIDTLKAQAADYEAQLLTAGFIAPRSEDEGGNGENFILTERGLQLLSMIDSRFPGDEHHRDMLNQHGMAALVPEIFDGIAAKLISP